MGTLLVLVNGLPGAGKSTVGRALAQVSGARFLSKDAVKEALATCVEDPAGLTDLGGIAMSGATSRRTSRGPATRGGVAPTSSTTANA
ncbi:putative kinase [Nocardia kruczakiae]|uniref:Kinase n=1 Tax=Nocardia kruczakiae TaxID=261477 RepID=A0ABU1XF93_9NOCA|nr:AAA family ATPase [Nocardia kruczakiae]MDR7169214.1 putative kinase [Nocardia kruczakiae]